MIITQGYGWEGLSVGGDEIDVVMNDVLINIEVDDISVEIEVNENEVEVET